MTFSFSFKKKSVEPEQKDEYSKYLKDLTEPCNLIAKAMIDRPKTFKLYREVLAENPETRYRKIKWTLVDTVTGLKAIQTHEIEGASYLNKNLQLPCPMSGREVSRLKLILEETRDMRRKKIRERKRQAITKLYQT